MKMYFLIMKGKRCTSLVQKKIFFCLLNTRVPAVFTFGPSDIKFVNIIDGPIIVSLYSGCRFSQLSPALFFSGGREATARNTSAFTGSLIMNDTLTTFYDIPGKGPSPGGMKSDPRIRPSLTGILFTPSAMYHF